jgi:hypothetical protein
MLSTKELQERLGWQIERVISESPDPGTAMEEIATEAERRGLIDSAASLRRHSSLAFVMDLWFENAAVHDLRNLHRQTLRYPKRLQDVADVLDALP